MLVSSKKILEKALKRKCAIGAFNFSNLEGLQSIISGALQTKSPVIVQTTPSAIEYAGISYLRAMVDVAARVSIPVVLHLDHAKDLALVKLCLKEGYTSVMFDGSSLPLKENMAQTRRAVQMAQKVGVSVEGELGAIKGKEDMISVAEREAFYTDPLEAQRFVAHTGVDVLAVSVGTAHGPYKFDGEPELDFARLSRISTLVRIPLVLHGSSGISLEIIDTLHNHCSDLGDCARLSGARGVPDAAIRKAIRYGVAKINIDSDLRIAFTTGVRDGLLNHTDAYDPRVFLSEARDLMTHTVIQKMKLFGSPKVLKSL